MEGTVSAPPQRVCPKCGRISWATGPRCPYCRARFRRQSTGVIAWMLTAAVLVTLAGVAALLLIFSNHVNDRADRIESQFNAIQRDIDRRLPENGIPSATPFPTPSAIPTPSPSPSPTATETATPSPSATPSATKTPSSGGTTTP